MAEHPVRSLYQLRFERRTPAAWTHPESVEDATHATISVQHGRYPTAVALPLAGTKAERDWTLHQREAIERLMELAYEAGDRDARASIRTALGVR